MDLYILSIIIFYNIGEYSFVTQVFYLNIKYLNIIFKVFINITIILNKPVIINKMVIKKL